MTFSKQQLIIAAVFMVVLVMLVSVLLTSHTYKKQEKQYFEKIIAIQDSAISTLRSDRTDLLNRYDSISAFNQKEAGNAVKKVTANQPNYKKNTDQYEAIPAIIRSLSRDSLRRAVENY